MENDKSLQTIETCLERHRMQRIHFKLVFLKIHKAGPFVRITGRRNRGKQPYFRPKAVMLTHIHTVFFTYKTLITVGISVNTHAYRHVSLLPWETMSLIIVSCTHLDTDAIFTGDPSQLSHQLLRGAHGKPRRHHRL